MNQMEIMESMILWRLANRVFGPDGEGEIVQSEAISSVTQLPPSDIGATFIKMLLTFVVLIILLVATYWLIRKLIQDRNQRGVGTQSIQILEKRMISAKTMLYLVEVENKKILLAESHLEIKRLASLCADEENKSEVSVDE